MINVGQNLYLNNRRWHIRLITPLAESLYDIEVIGSSTAAQGMTRALRVIQVGENLYLEQPRQNRYWQANLGQDWITEDYGDALQCRPATKLDVLDKHTQLADLGDLTNTFSWSYSRMNRYNYCPRAYYYHYYAAWDGWLDIAPYVAQRAYLLKNLTDIPRWIGTLVHEAIKFALARLKAKQPVEKAALIQQMRTRAQADFTQSQTGQYKDYPNQMVGFQEHYYKSGLTEKDWQTAWQQAEQYLITFLDSSLYQGLQQSTETFLDVETLQSFEIDETTIWIQMDFAQFDQSTINIYDWKTGLVGDEDALKSQLGVYSLYFRHKHPDLFEGRALQGLVYDLRQNQVITVQLDEKLIQDTEEMIKSSIAKLRDLLTNPSNLTTIEHFPMISDLTICGNCQFRELCNRK